MLDRSVDEFVNAADNPAEEPATIREAIERGTVACPTCGAGLPVARNGQVTVPCASCGYGAGQFWNLFVQTF